MARSAGPGWVVDAVGTTALPVPGPELPVGVGRGVGVVRRPVEPEATVGRTNVAAGTGVVAVVTAVVPCWGGPSEPGAAD